jgi:hypothetical protein
MSVPAVLMLLLGLFLAIWPGKPIALLVRGLDWQRRNIPDPSLRLQERIVKSRVALWFVRLFGALLVLGFVVSLTAPAQGTAR